MGWKGGFWLLHFNFKKKKGYKENLKMFITIWLQYKKIKNIFLVGHCLAIASNLMLHSICYLCLVLASIIHNLSSFCTANEKIWITSFTTIWKNIETFPTNFNDLPRKFVFQITRCVAGHHNHFANCKAFGEISYCVWRAPYIYKYR